MNSKSQKTSLSNILLKTLAILTTIGILLVVMAGALVTKTGSGEGCGANWPLCHDRLIPENPTPETIIEYTHRLVTGVVGLLILSFSIWMAIKYRHIREIRFVIYSAIFFLLLQSALGALAVLYGQSSAIKALHFGFSLLSFASILLLCIYVFQLTNKQALPSSLATSKTRLYLLLLFVYTYIVVYIGAYVRHTGSSMGCAGWPLCNGQFIPELTGQTGIQFGHRIAALLLFIFFVAFYIHTKKHLRQDIILYRGSLWLALLCFLQVLSGGLLILSGIHLIPSLIHAFLISILFGILCYLILYVLRPNK